MTRPSPKIDWTEIGLRLELRDPANFVETKIVPLLEAVPAERLSSKGKRRNRLELPMTLAMVGFGATQVALMISGIHGLITFILFLPLFFGWTLAVLFLFRGRFASAFLDGRERFIIRSKSLSRLANELALEYVPSPGGAPEALKLIAKQKFAPNALKEACEVLDAHGGMDEALATARRSGTMVLGTVLGNKDQREKHYDAAAKNVQVEDGFQGALAGIEFSAFEWKESKDDASPIYHLVIVVRAPHRLHGITQLRTRNISWPGGHPDARFHSVGVVAPEFESRFRMRTTDQVEARTVFDPAVIERVAELGHGEKVRAVAFEDHLVIDVEGTDRFAMVNLVTGEWNSQTIADSMMHVAEMLELVKAIANVFRLEPSHLSANIPAKNP